MRTTKLLNALRLLKNRAKQPATHRQCFSWPGVPFCLTLLLVLIVLSVVLYASVVPAQAQTYSSASWRTFTIADGLASNNVQAIYQDNQGILWFGTFDLDGGVSRYRDEQWQTFTVADGLASNEVLAINQDDEGAMWFGTFDGGVSRYQNGAWRTFTSADGLASNSVLAIYQDDEGTLWFGTGGGVSRYQDGVWQTFTTADGLADNRVLAITQDDEGAMWFGTLDGGVSRYQNGAWRTFTSADGLASNSVSVIAPDYEGAMWFGTIGGGISRYQDGVWQTFTTADGLVDNFVQAIAQDDEGAMWFGTYGGGVSRYQDGVWQTFTTTDGLADNRVLAITQDDEGAMWFGTRGGVNRYQDGVWQIFTAADGLADNNVLAINQDDEGAMWFGTGGGVSRYQNGAWRTFTTADGLADNNVWAIYQDDEGAMWFGGGGVSRYQAGVWQTFSTADGLASNVVWAIYQDDEGAMWFGTNGGVSRYQAGVWQTLTTADGLADNNVLAINQDDEGAMWFGTGGGVSRYQNGAWRTFTTADGLANYQVQAITQDDKGAIWFGTLRGVSRYQDGVWQTFTPADGLVNYYVQAITQDDKGAIWFGTLGGVSRYQAGVWQIFTTADGLVHNNVEVITQDDEGSLWFGTRRGVSRYQPGTMPPGVWLMSINEQLYPERSPLSLAVDTDHLTITFEGGDAATLTEDLVYVHRLVGASEEWITTPQQFAVYPDLLPGHYTFQVKALDRDGNFSEPAEVEIIIPPPLPQAMPMVTLFGRSLPQTTLYGYGLAGLMGLVVATVAFNRWRAHRRTRQAIARKENPYVANLPVKDPEMFFGRDDILSQIINGIDRNNFAVCGPKRFGKTSLLHQLAVALPQLEDAPCSFQPVMLSLHGVAEESFFYHLGQALAQQTRSAPASLSLSDHDGKSSYDRYQFLEDLETVHQTLQATSTKSVRLVLLVDEGDALNEYDQPTLAHLRHVFMGPGLEYLKMVWTGQALDQRPWQLPGSDWLTIFGHVFNLTPLTEEEATRLIREPVPFYHYDQEAVRLILTESQLIPHRIQLLCRAAVEEMLKEGRGRIKVKHVEAAMSSLTGETASASLSPWATPAAGAEAIGPGIHRLAETPSEYQPEAEDEEAE